MFSTNCFNKLNIDGFQLEELRDAIRMRERELEEQVEEEIKGMWQICLIIFNNVLMRVVAHQNEYMSVGRSVGHDVITKSS